MRSAPCALAPSHPLHVMPSRITRNSHRPRASDRTVVALKHHLACRSLKPDGRVTIGRETHEDGQPSKLIPGNESTVGWISRKKSFLRSRRSFFLDIPSLFIELIEATDSRAVRNKNNVLALYDLMINRKRSEEATAKFVSPSYIQHNPLIPDGSVAQGGRGQVTSFAAN
jgi:hypothetical protein